MQMRGVDGLAATSLVYSAMFGSGLKELAKEAFLVRSFWTLEEREDMLLKIDGKRLEVLAVAVEEVGVCARVVKRSGGR